MSLHDQVSVDDVYLHLLVRLLQVALLGIALIGLIRFNWGLVINASVSLGVTFLPGILSRDYRVPLSAGLTLWITTAVFLHAVGALGPYQWFGWYDSVTHTLSATIVAGAGYASAQALAEHDDSLEIPSEFMFVFILVFVLAFGVLWEILEFASGGVASLIGGEAVLAQYGVSDIVLDLAFNAVGALIVATLGTDHLRDVARGIARTLST
ncbi:DUF2238 domain-containing protein [Haladaptatus pallidirubidus]|uniref:Uncharacterized protein n=1 Tax=Haladaptatus pallidirubidus TaxID=1008152 RepID=A0AAV3UHK3_9EURY|nr:DUF2238 domain-containing protein [Haladaptatus pallidirubidus]